MFDVLAEQDSKFRQIQPCVIVIGHGSEGAQMPNLVFQSTGGHRVLIQINGECKCRMVVPVRAIEYFM